MICPITPWSENVRGHLQRETFGEDKTHKKLPTWKVWVGRLPTLPTHMHKYSFIDRQTVFYQSTLIVTVYAALLLKDGYTGI